MKKLFAAALAALMLAASPLAAFAEFWLIPTENFHIAGEWRNQRPVAEYSRITPGIGYYATPILPGENYIFIFETNGRYFRWSDQNMWDAFGRLKPGVKAFEETGFYELSNGRIILRPDGSAAQFEVGTAEVSADGKMLKLWLSASGGLELFKIGGVNPITDGGNVPGGGSGGYFPGYGPNDSYGPPDDFDGSGFAQIEINHLPVMFYEHRPVYINGNLYAPIRAVFEMLGFRVDWNEDMRLAAISNGEYSSVVVADNTVFSTNGRSYALEAQALIINDRMYAPLRALLESVGCTVVWDEGRGVLMIFTDGFPF